MAFFGFGFQTMFGCAWWLDWFLELGSNVQMLSGYMSPGLIQCLVGLAWLTVFCPRVDAKTIDPRLDPRYCINKSMEYMHGGQPAGMYTWKV